MMKHLSITNIGRINKLTNKNKYYNKFAEVIERLKLSVIYMYIFYSVELQVYNPANTS